MPISPSHFKAPFLIQNGHVQTILPVVWARVVSVAFQRERLELTDGDFLDLDWLRSGKTRLAIISHGLEGSSEGGYIIGMAETMRSAGWDVLAWNFRGCSGETNRLLRSYHSSESADLRSVIEHAAGQYSEVVLIGFSLGGNITLKYLGEKKPHDAIRAAVAVSVPIDLAASARKLDQQWSNQLYLRRFMTSLIAKMEDKAQRFPGQLDTKGIHSIHSFQEFDDRFTAPIHGFADAKDYWKRSSSRQFLPRIEVPTLLLNALNDPFLPVECFPYDEAKQSAFLFLEMPASGGHVGFLQGIVKRQPWYEGRAIQFFKEQVQS